MNENFLLVGILEELEDVLLLLERFLPHYFKGVLSIYKDPGNFVCKQAILCFEHYLEKDSGNKGTKSSLLLMKESPPGLQSKVRAISYD